MVTGELSKIRQEYQLSKLEETDVDPSPYRQFGIWMDDAIRAEIEEPTAMALATSGRDGRPSVRMVLLKDFDQRGFSFFTNYNSRKGEEIASNRHVSLLFYWKELERQVRVEGTASRITVAESDEYFAARPAGSQVGAIISPQSEVIPGREFLELARQEYLSGNPARHERPRYWGGYRVKPSSVEFWQGRPDRLHDRILYTFENKHWVIQRLAP